MSSFSYPYCTLGQVQDETQNIDPADYGDLTDAINQASRWIDWYCQRDFLFHDHATTPLPVPDDWCMQNLIYLPWPVLTLTRITVTDLLGAATDVPTTDYRVDDAYLTAGGRIRRMGHWLTGDEFISGGLVPGRLYDLKAQVKLYGTFGYTPALTGGQTPVADPTKPSPNIPAEIQVACAVIAAVRSGKARKEIIDFSGQRQTATVKVIPKDVMSMLNRYRRSVL